MLTSVGVLRSTETREYQVFARKSLDDSMIVQSGDLGFVEEDITGTGKFTGGTYRAVFDPSLAPVTVLPQELEVSVLLVPADAYEGEVEIQLFMDGSYDARSDGTRAILRFAGGTYTAELRTYVGGTQTESTLPGTIYSDRPNTPGKFLVRFTNAGTIEMYFRDQQVLSGSISTTPGLHMGIEVNSTDASIHATQLNREWIAPDLLSMANQIPNSQVRQLIVAIAGGNIYYETTADSLKQVIPPSVFDDIPFCSVDREQSLYIADYGNSSSGTDSLTGTTLTVSSTVGLSTSQQLQIVGSDFTQNEKQQITIGGATGGTFTATLEGSTTPAINHNATATDIDSAFAAIGFEVTTVGANPWTVEFKGSRAEQDVALVTLDTSNLTTGTSITSSVTEQQKGYSGDVFNGTYPITSLGGTTIDFTATFPIAAAGVNVDYRVAKPPKIFKPSDESVTNHTAAAGKGFVPIGSRLVALYRDRIVYAGQDDNPHIWYMSRQGDPDDWDFSQDDAGAAVAAQSSQAGQIADPITALINHGDNCVIFGCYNSLWILRGDPQAGGRINELSTEVGIVGCDAWCKTPENSCCFMTADGLYIMPAGCGGPPTSLSRERMPNELLCLTEEREHVSLAYDTFHRGVHIFVTRNDGSRSVHWWFDWETKAFWPFTLTSNHEPFAIHERIQWDDCAQVLIAGRDGKTRFFDQRFHDDDGEQIDSYCLFGPFPLSGKDGISEGVINDVHITTSRDSGAASCEIRTAQSFEEAAYGQDVNSVTAGIGRSGLNYTIRPKTRGHAAAIAIQSTGRWLIERISTVIKQAGKLRVR